MGKAWEPSPTKAQSPRSIQSQLYRLLSGSAVTVDTPADRAFQYSPIEAGGTLELQTQTPPPGMPPGCPGPSRQSFSFLRVFPDVPLASVTSFDYLQDPKVNPVIQLSTLVELPAQGRVL